MSPVQKYTRETELRHVDANDVYRLGTVGGLNDCWKKLMEIIPKELNALASSVKGSPEFEKALASGRKYSVDQIRVIEEYVQSLNAPWGVTQVLFNEWGTSGRKVERPTVGVLLELLVHAELFRAADFVATNFLNENVPKRPDVGPAAIINITLDSDIFQDINSQVNDYSYYPSTQALNENAAHSNSMCDLNKDYYVKYRNVEKEILALPSDGTAKPVPPPRTKRTHLSNYNSTEASAGEANASANLIEFSQQQATVENTKHISSGTSQLTSSACLSQADMPMISIFGGNSSPTKAQADQNVMISAEVADVQISTNNELPLISALNLNGESDSPSDTKDAKNGADLEAKDQNIINADQKIENEADNMNRNTEDDDDVDEYDDDDEDDEDDDFDDDFDDELLPELSILEQRSSNNDSSLTNVTGTSGDNSFEISGNDCSSASNENIPCLTALKP